MKRITTAFFIAVFGMAAGIAALYTTPLSGEQLTGTQTATVEHNRSFDTFNISLSPGGHCTVKVGNDNAEQETTTP